MYFIAISLMAFWFTERLTFVNDYLYQTINGLAGRSWIFDTLIALPLESNLVILLPAESVGPRT